MEKPLKRKVKEEKTKALTLNEIFEKAVDHKSIIINREALRSDYLPETLPHRESYINQLAQLWSPALRRGTRRAREKPANTLISGMPGTGKTATVKYVKKKLMGKLKTMKKPPSVHINLVNVRISGSVYGTIQQLCRINKIKAPRGLSKADLFTRLKTMISKTDAVFIVVLDEIDYVTKAKSFLYSMLRINEFLSDMGSTARCSICGITNNLRFKEFLDPGTLSSLGQQAILFRKYDASAINNIIEDRVKIAFAQKTVDVAAIRLISALSASRGGDARWAIDLLRTAGELADMNGVKLTANYVEEAEQKLTQNMVRDAVVNLSKHHQIILVAIVKGLQRVSVEAPILFDKYIELCHHYICGLIPISYRRFHQLVNELDSAGILIAKNIYQGKGRAKKISLAVPANVLKEALSLDPVLAEFF